MITNGKTVELTRHEDVLFSMSRLPLEKIQEGDLMATTTAARDALERASLVRLWDGEVGKSEYRIYKDGRGRPSYAAICQPSPLPGWHFSRAEHHPATVDGGCMADPTPEYYRVWAHPDDPGVEGTMGCGPTPQVALAVAVSGARAKQTEAEARANGERMLEVALGVMSGRLTHGTIAHSDLCLLMNSSPAVEATAEAMQRQAELVVYRYLLPGKPTRG